MKKTLIFFRHAEPDINMLNKKKGIKFLGRKEDPSITIPDKDKILQFKKYLQDFDLFIYSPMKRCKETISLLTDKTIMENSLLLEIDYGDIDGMYLEEVKDKYTYLFESWERGLDPRFPGGENNLDVIRRIKLFLKFLFKLKKDKISICTHNVFLRCLIGSSLKIPVKDWFRIEIPYFEPIRFIFKKNKLIYAGSPEQKRRLLRNIPSKSFYTYFIALIPEKRLFSKVCEIKKQIFKMFGNQRYLSDPPHCTLYVSLAEDLNEVKEIIKYTILNKKPINFTVLNEYQEFKQDQFAGGGTSLALKFDNFANKNIIDLQRKLITKLNTLRGNKVHPRYNNADLPIVLKNNINKYGFPFVGDVLIPHINFCSFNPPLFVERFKRIYSPNEFQGNFKFNKLGLFKIYNDDKVELIKTFNLQ